jgi:hypothetical protein
MMVKSAKPGKGVGGGARPSPFILSTIANQVVVYAPAERADTLSLFLLYPYMYSVVLLYPHPLIGWGRLSRAVPQEEKKN